MNAVELAKLFTDYAETKAKLTKLEEQIQAQVLEIGKSQAIAGVKATYYNPTVKYDYFLAAMDKRPTPEQIGQFSTTTTTTKWKELAESIGADLKKFEKAEPARVVVK